MANKKFHKNRFSSNHYKNVSRLILNRQKKLIEDNYDFLKCSIKKNKLECKGITKPTSQSSSYKFIIVYDGLSAPKVNILEPDIEYDEEIHMFPKDKSLCLYHSETDNLRWDYRKHNLFDTIIPWTLEWFIYYELFNITGNWEHPHIDHRLQNIKTIEVNN